MPSIFELFGELSLKSDSLEAGLKRIDARLQATDANLDKVIAASNRLGDTSATVARRYEKFGEGLQAQRQRILDNVIAFQRGDVTAQQFGKTIASVETRVASLTSRIKDATARTTELSETGFTHFQNQIRGGVTESQHSLINLNAARPLQGLGPVLQGLGARQYGLDETLINILIVAAREAGVLKVAAQGTAAATSAATASELAFSNAAKQAAGSQALVAAESEATASAMSAASSQTTLFGVGLAAIGSLLAAGVVSIIAAKKASEDVLAAAEKRLHTEENIAAALNQQYLAIAKLKSDSAEGQGDRDFDRFLNSGRQRDLQEALANKRKEFDDNAKAITEEVNRRAAIVNAVGSTGKVADRFINEGNPQLDPEKGKVNPDSPAFQAADKLQQQIHELEASLDDIKNSGETGADFIKRVQKTQVDNLAKADKKSQSNREAQLKAAQASENASLKANYSIQEALLAQHLKIQEASEFTSISETTNLKNKQLADQIASDKKYYSQLIENAKDPQEATKFQAELTDKVTAATAQMRVNAIKAFTDSIEAAKNLKKEVQSIFVEAADNKYYTIWDQTARSIEHVREVFKGLHSDSEKQAELFIRMNGLAKDFAEQLSDKLSATSLRLDAARYAAGVNEAGYRSAGAQSYAEFRQQKLAENLFESQNRFAINAEDYNAQKSAFVTDFVDSFKNKRIQSNLETSLNAINAYGNNFNPNVSSAEFNAQKLQQSLPEFREKLDQKIIELTGKYDPTQLTRDQNRLASDARLDLAKIEESKRKEALDALNANTAALQDLLKKGGIKLDIYDHTKRGTTRITTNPTSADTDDYYNR